MDELPTNDTFDAKGIIDFHGGYRVCDLVIKRRWTTFKEEILNYQDFDITNYENEIIPKSNEYIKIDIIKQIRAEVKDKYSLRIAPKHYELAHETNPYYEKKLPKENLIAIILYTDYTNLSSVFTSSFRKISVYESLDSVILRNRKFYWLSRILRETVELYGSWRIGKENKALSGPFYCGMSFLMNFGAFAIRLCYYYYY